MAAAGPGNTPRTPREEKHLQAIAAVLDDDYPRAKASLGAALHAEPRDVLALQVAHALDYVTGDMGELAARVARVRPAWSRTIPGYHAVLAMNAFGLAENGSAAAAEEAARAALELEQAVRRLRRSAARPFTWTACNKSRVPAPLSARGGRPRPGAAPSAFAPRYAVPL